MAFYNLGDQGEDTGIESRSMHMLGTAAVELRLWPDLLLLCAYDLCAGPSWEGTQVTVHRSEGNSVEPVFSFHTGL